MGWTPANEGHAIERVAATIRFKDALTSKVLGQLQADVAKRASEAGISEVLRMQAPPQIQFVAGPNFPVQPVNMPPLGQIMRRTEDGRVLEEVICTAENFIFAGSDYIGWADFIGKMQRCFEDPISRVVQVVDIHELRLEYWDRFDRKPNEDGPDRLLNQASVLVSQVYEERSGSWHSHTGYFSPSIPGRRTLINTNIDVIALSDSVNGVFPDQVEAQARIYTLVALQTTDNAKEVASDWKEVRDALETEHARLKSVLGNLINPELAIRITLNANAFEA